MPLLAHMLHSVMHPGFLCPRLLLALYWHCQTESTVVGYVSCANGAQGVGDPFGLDAVLYTENDWQMERIKASSSRTLSSDPYLAKGTPPPQPQWIVTGSDTKSHQESRRWRHDITPYHPIWPRTGTGFPKLWWKPWLLRFPLYHSGAAGQAFICGCHLNSGQNETFCFQALFYFKCICLHVHQVRPWCLQRPEGMSHPLEM